MSCDSDFGSNFFVPNSTNNDSDCKSRIYLDNEIDESEIDEINEINEIDIYSAYNKGKYSSSYEYFTKPPVTYFIANVNGELSREIYGSPVINDQVTLLNISSITKSKTMNFESKSSPMSIFLGNENNKTIDIFVGYDAGYKKNTENKWLIDRGIFNINGHVIIMSKCGDFNITTSEAIKITDDLLLKSDKSIIGEFYSRNKKKPKFNFGLKKCSFCKKYNRKIIECFCKRKVYCNLRCMSDDSKTHHATRIHSGVFL